MKIHARAIGPAISSIAVLLGLLAVLVLLITIPARALFGQTAVNGSRTIVGAVNYCADAGSSDAYACSLSPAITAYVTGAIYHFRANTANTGAATLNLNSLGAKSIVKAAGGVTTALADNDIRVGQAVTVIYDGTNLQMQSTLGNASAGGGGGTTYTQGPGIIIDGTVIRLDGAVTNSVFQASANLNFGSIAANACSYLTMTVSGALQGEAAVVSAPNLEDGFVPTVRLSANNTARVGLCNNTGGSITAADQAFRVVVIRSF